MWTFVAIIFFAYFHYGHLEECPAPEIVRPCRCIKDGSGVSVHCSVGSLNELTKVVQEFHSRIVYSFFITDSTFEYIPYSLFENVTVQKIEISNSNFSRIGKLGCPQFKGLENSLQTLKFTKSFTRLYPFAYVFMENLTKLSTLEVHNSYVGFINNHWFKNGPKSLRIIRFVKCNIRAIGYTALNSLINLKIIDLSENELTYIPKWVFPEPASYLIEINLERNKLEYFPEDFFTNMPYLEKVNLELNKFSTIDESLWRPVWSNLEHINIDYNPIICDQKLKWIYELEDNLEGKLIATCYKPFNLMDRELHSLQLEELK